MSPPQPLVDRISAGPISLVESFVLSKESCLGSVITIADRNARAAGEPAVVAQGLVKKFGSLTAVAGVTLDVPRGSLFGFLGPNGSGKSTTVRLLTGLMEPTSGLSRVMGHDVSQRPVEVRKVLGVVPDFPHLFERLTAREYLNFVGRIHGLPAQTVVDRREELLGYLKLSEAADRLIADYSHGMKKKTALCGALIHGPKVLFLDEPFEGIDPASSIDIRNLLTELVARDVTVFMTSHVLEIVERLCTHIAILFDGRVASYGTKAELGPLEPLFLSVTGAQSSTIGLSWLE